MHRVNQPAAGINPVETTVTEKLRVVRSACARPTGVFTSASAFTVGSDGRGAARIRSRFDAPRRRAA